MLGSSGRRLYTVVSPLLTIAIFRRSSLTIADHQHMWDLVVEIHARFELVHGLTPLPSITFGDRFETMIMLIGGIDPSTQTM